MELAPSDPDAALVDDAQAILLLTASRRSGESIERPAARVGRRVVWLLTLSLAVAACGPADPPSSPTAGAELGTVAVRTARVANEGGFFASEHYARLSAPDGTRVKEWRLSENDVTSVDVPAGSYLLDTFTVFLSDTLKCDANGQNCAQPTMGPAMYCSAPITVDARARTEALYSILADGACRLGLGPMPAST